ncbi:MAG: PAS domain S-box protein [Bacteroidales bacterium]
MKNTHKKSEATILRRKAEELLKKRTSAKASQLSEVEMLKLIHELDVHQIELEMQNEELMHAKEQLAKAATDKYAELYDFAPTGYFTLSKEGEIIELNLSGATMLGKERLLLRNSRFGFFVSNDTKPVFNLFLKKIFESKNREDCDVTLSTTGNLPVYVHLNGIVNKKGDQSLVTMVDITERKLAEISLRKSEEIFRIITENTTDVIAILDMDFNIIYLSPSVEKIRGYKWEEAMSQKPEQILTPASLHKFLEMARNIIPAEKDGTARVSSYPAIELEQVHKNGSTVWVELSFSFLKDVNNKSTGIVTVSRDVTRRKKVDEAMRQGEANLREAQRLSHLGSWEWTMATDTVKWSEELYHINGRDPKSEAPSYAKMFLYYTSESRNRLGEAVKKALKTGEPYALELEIVRTDGSVRHTFARGEIDYDSSGKISGLHGTVQDITSRKLMEKSLRKSEELYKSLILNSSELIILSDTQGITTFCSPQCEKVLGYPGEKFIGVTMPDIIHPDDAARCQKTWENIFLSGQDLEDFEYRIVDPHGSVRWVSHSAKWVSSNDPSYGVHNTIRNITDRKIAEQVIRVSEEKFRTMLNASPDGMVLIDLKGIIMEVSEIGLNLFGADERVDMVGRNILQFVPDSETAILKELLEKTTDEGFTQNTGLTVKRKDESVFTGEISSTLMQDQNGVPISYMIILRDVSQRIKMEAKQIHSDRMSTLGEMAAGIAHEIGQPLNIISMVMDKILFETARTEIVDVEFLKIKSDKIFENITRIRDIIDHVRAFSRNRDDYVNTSFNVNSSIVNASSMIMEQFKHYAISLNLQLEQQIAKIVGNTYKFEQVILNLLVNAKDAVNEKKNQHQDFEMQVGIRSWQENQSIFVEVADNGIGISKDDIHNIMLPFYTTKEEGKGTGLGLSISYQIIRAMNGTIEITSEKLVGTKIKLILPVQDKK